MFILHTSNLVQVTYNFHTCSKHIVFFVGPIEMLFDPYINGTALTGIIVLKSIRHSTEDLSIPSTNGTLFNGTCSVSHALKTSVRVRSSCPPW
jgi:hypothetical protein